MGITAFARTYTGISSNGTYTSFSQHAPSRRSPVKKFTHFIISPVEQHSKKPDITREKILALMGDLPRIELFARQHTPGWDVWGNEIKSDIRFAGKEV